MIGSITTLGILGHDTFRHALFIFLKSTHILNLLRFLGIMDMLANQSWYLTFQIDHVLSNLDTSSLTNSLHAKESSQFLCFIWGWSGSDKLVSNQIRRNICYSKWTMQSNLCYRNTFLSGWLAKRMTSSSSYVFDFVTAVPSKVLKALGILGHFNSFSPRSQSCGWSLSNMGSVEGIGCNDCYLGSTPPYFARLLRLEHSFLERLSANFPYLLWRRKLHDVVEIWWGHLCKVEPRPFQDDTVRHITDHDVEHHIMDHPSSTIHQFYLPMGYLTSHVQPEK